MRTVSQYVAEQLEAFGIEVAFGVPGSDILGLLNAMDQQGHIRFFAVHHEETAALMAAAYAEVTGGPALVLTHSGPGAAHLVNGLYSAFYDRLPVLAITGQVPTRQQGTLEPQATDLSAMLSSCTALSLTLQHPDAVGEVLTRAFQEAVSRGLPAHIGLPQDIQMLPTKAVLRIEGEYLGRDPSPDPDAIQAAVDLLNRARYPLIQIGRGARGAALAVRTLAERLEAPIVCSLPAKGVIPARHRLMLGPLGEAGTEAARQAARRADVLLTVGSTWWPSQAGFPPPPAASIDVDTRAATIGESYPAGIGIVAPAEEAVPAILSGLKPRRARAWIDTLAAVREVWEAKEMANTPTAFHPRRVLEAIAAALPEDGIITVDTGAHTLWFGNYYPARQETVLLSGRWRTMGYALPAALAAKIARPESLVVGIVGDGGLSMSLPDLVTAPRYGLALVLVVFNNGTLGMEVYTAHEQGQRAVGMGLDNPEFARIAAAAGWVGRRVQPDGDLAAILRDSLEQDAPVLLDVPVLDVPPPYLDRM